MLIHDLMNRLTTLSRRLPATFLALAATAGFRADAQITLSGAAMFAAGPDGTPGAGGNGGVWNSIGPRPSNPYNIYFFTGTTRAPVFLNRGDTDALLNPRLRLVPGTNTIGFAASQGLPLILDKDFLGLNFYFDDDLRTNRMTAVVAANGSTAFRVVGPEIRTWGEGLMQGGAGSLSYVTRGWTATLSRLQIVRPFVDLVSPFGAFQDGAPDIVGTFTLSVVQTELWMTIRSSEVEVCWGTEPGRTYQVQFRSPSTGDAWTNLGERRPAGGDRDCLQDPVTEVDRVYRVILVP